MIAAFSSCSIAPCLRACCRPSLTALSLPACRWRGRPRHRAGFLTRRRIRPFSPPLLLICGEAAEEELHILELIRDRLKIDRLIAAALERSARARFQTL